LYDKPNSRAQRIICSSTAAGTQVATTSIPAAQVMMAPLSVLPALMDDLVEEILLRLPPDDPESLLRAALV
jgi:hypothetical protein